MQEFSGSIFNGLNGIERVALADADANVDINNMTLEQIQNYGSQVDYFSSETQDALAALTSLDGLADVVGGDYTTEELAARNQQRSDYNMRVGQSALREAKFMANMGMPLGDRAELYGFGGMSFRNGESGCFYRLPSQSRTTTSIWPNGTVPKINSNITDKSIGGGIKGMVGNWQSDLSIVTGTNEFLYHISDSHNATLGSASPTAMDAGGHSFTQTTSNFDISQYFDGMSFIDGANVALA